MTDSSSNPELEQFLERTKVEVDQDALANLNRQVETETRERQAKIDAPWQVPCPEPLRGARYLIREHVRILTAKRSYDVSDPDSGQLKLAFREPKLGKLEALVRIFDKAADSDYVFECRDNVDRVFMWMHNNKVVNHLRQELGLVEFRSLNSMDGKPRVRIEVQDGAHCFYSLDNKLASIERSGSVAKRLLTRSEDSLLTFTDSIPDNDPRRLLILAAVVWLDICNDQEEAIRLR